VVQTIEMKPVAQPVKGVVRPPGSKSITNRALVCAALAEGRSELHGALQSEDTEVMINSLRDLGIVIQDNQAADSLNVIGCGGAIPAASADLYVANSGTTVRFLTALVSLGRGDFRLDGNERMRERPISDLTSALHRLGVSVHDEADSGCPPLVVKAAGLPGGEVSLRGDLSSQYLSALLMAAPYAQEPTTVHITGPLVSQPYVDMTIEVMRQFGVDVQQSEGPTFEIRSGQSYLGLDFTVEPDASAASYFWAAAAITGGEVTVEGLTQESLQGDVAFCDCLAKMGCEVRYQSDRTTVAGKRLTGITVDMKDISDTVQTLAAVALFADSPTTISGVGHIRHKETDRIGNLAIELRRLGAGVEELPDGLKIEPGLRRGAQVRTYDDHRMAMSLSLVGLKTPGVIIEDPGCTRKTYPKYFAELEDLCNSA